MNTEKGIPPKKRVRGGIHTSHDKNTMFMPARRLDCPEKVTIPMQQCIGAPCVPTVNVGDKVKAGQKIGDSDKFVSAPVHASISGTVTFVGDVRLATGALCQAVTIESDGLMEPFEGITPPDVTDKESFLKAVRESGAVGLGGAGFPTHVKLNTDKNIDTLIVNAAECEPYITVDYREAVDNSWDVLSGVFAIKDIMKIPHVVIAVEDNKPEAIKILTSIAAKSPEVDIMCLKTKYPQGAEKMVVYSVTGRKVPVGGLPADVGCIVMNIATVAFLARYLKTGKPLISRSLTFDGTAVKNPQNVRVPIGTSIRYIIDACGGFSQEARKVILGGPMMGVAVFELDGPVCKRDNAILAFSKESEKKEYPCINCGRCVSVCPINLEPVLLRRAIAARDTESIKKLGVTACMECGCCEYTCPSGLPLVQYLRLGKQYLREEKK